MTTRGPRRFRAIWLCAWLALATAGPVPSIHAAPPASRAPEAAGDSWIRKLDPFLRRMALGSSWRDGRFDGAIPPGSVAARRSLPSFVLAESGDAGPVLFVKGRLETARVGETGVNPAGGETALVQRLAAIGVEVRGRVGAIASLRVPAAALEGLARLQEVVWLKAAHGYRTQNEISTGPGQVASDEASATFGTRGAGVIVAVVDTGIDWTNLDFRNADGTTRLLGLWDQTLSDPLHPPPDGFSFGAFYGRADIDAALASGGGLATADGHGHGSHVAGSAAGNGLQTGLGVPAGTFAGVAPEADLIAVRVFNASGIFCAACDLTAAVQFIQRSAAAAGKPWVGNMSLGTNLGAHDGSDPDELTIDAAVGPGHPGASLAVAAGNSGASRIHWEGTLTTGSVLGNSFTLPSYSARTGSDNDFIWLDLWHAASDQMTVEVVTPGGTHIAASTGTDSGIVCTTSGAVQVDARNAPDAANGADEVFVQIWDSGSCSPVRPPRSGTWSIQILGDGIAPGGGRFDLWDEADLSGPNSVTLATYSLSRTVTVPGTSRHALTAA
ncbi:MAG TPA: S8 family serine peptidase, partial [Candidatus Polarisedimenticolia bacterium]|nr:S8 family serine peptidase [Candidatus Polarisedimenticolia bacterium]